MLRIARVSCCAVVAWGLILIASALAGDEADDPLAKFEQGNSYKNAEERIKAILDEPLKAPLDFTEQPLVDIINFLQEEYDLPIVFDNAALDEVGISPETEITINLRHIPLKSALNLMLKQPGVEDLTYVVEGEVLLITTEDRANSMLLVRLYRIDDLRIYADPLPNDPEGWVDFSPLVRVITSCIEADSWQTNETGEGDIIVIRPGVLVISQTHRVHDQIESLLSELRELKSEIEGETTPHLGHVESPLAE